MKDLATMIQNAIAGKYEPDLPEPVRVNIARLRERLLTDLPALTSATNTREEAERAWQENVTRIFEEAEQSLAIAIKSGAD